jgi:hypothetical protein
MFYSNALGGNMTVVSENLSNPNKEQLLGFPNTYSNAR